MGFWSSVGKVVVGAAKLVGNEIESQANELKQLKAEYKNKSDDELLRIARNEGMLGHSSKEKGAASSELRGRGYTQQQITEKT